MKAKKVIKKATTKKATKKATTKKKTIAGIVSYYMPIKLLNEFKILAERIGITINEIRIEDKDVRFYCTGSDRLLETFNELRVQLLGTQQPMELAPRK